MRKFVTIVSLAFLFPVGAMAADLVGEWSNEPENCDEMRILYTEEGEHPTKINADGNWVVVNEATWQRDGDVVAVTQDGRTDFWDIVELDDERVHMVNQDPEAEEFGVAETELYRCDPR